MIIIFNLIKNNYFRITFVSFGKAPDSIFVKEAGIVISFNEVQEQNALSAIDFTERGISIC